MVSSQFVVVSLVRDHGSTRPIGGSGSTVVVPSWLGALWLWVVPSWRTYVGSALLRGVAACQLTDKESAVLDEVVGLRGDVGWVGGWRMWYVGLDQLVSRHLRWLRDGSCVM